MGASDLQDSSSEKNLAPVLSPLHLDEMSNQSREGNNWLHCLTDPDAALGDLSVIGIWGRVCLHLGISWLESGVQKTRVGGGLRQKRDLSPWREGQGKSQ